MVTNKTTCKNILRTQSKASERHHPVEPSQTSSHLHFSKNMFSNKILKYIHLVSDNKRMEWKVSHSESSEISDRILTAPFRHNAVQKKCVWWLITYWSLLLSVVKVCRFTVSWVMCEQRMCVCSVQTDLQTMITESAEKLKNMMILSSADCSFYDF